MDIIKVLSLDKNTTWSQARTKQELEFEKREIKNSEEVLGKRKESGRFLEFPDIKIIQRPRI
eukprot:snap_masked-scaffold_65-processed-gene-0.32-mRNA-1 protein AED:1.00 eAED:1.00 QI:0/0/0/0/1/1/2/0/61